MRVGERADDRELQGLRTGGTAHLANRALAVTRRGDGRLRVGQQRLPGIRQRDAATGVRAIAPIDALQQAFASA